MVLTLEELIDRFAFGDVSKTFDTPALLLRIGPERAHRSLSYGELHRLSAGAARALRDRGCASGERIALLMPHDHRLVVLFFGAIYAGFVPCIIAWPTAKMDREKYRRNLHGVVAGLGADWIVTEHTMATELGETLGRTRVLDSVALTERVEDERVASAPCIGPADPFFIQFSGGTTGTQKSVPISAAKLFEQLSAYARVLEIGSGDRIISWLPLYHDMGLVACLLLPFVYRLPVIMFAPMEWVMNPTQFLDSIGRDEATVCWLPNFAFSFMARKVRPEAAFDFSTLRSVINCSEPVRAESMDAFATRFGSAGLRREALHTCYAMAEATFAVTQTTESEPPLRMNVSRAALGQGRVEPTANGERVLVSCGRPIPGIEARIIDETGTCENGAIGEIQLKGVFVMDDYLPSTDRCARWAFTEDGWFRTGDLGAWLDAHLFVTGRKKDVIIVGGVNIFPEDLEAAVGEIESIHPGRVVSMGLDDEDLGTEKLVIAAEVNEQSDLDRADELETAVRRTVLAVCGVAPSWVFIVPPRWIVKSTAGKISRVETRARVLERWTQLTERDA